MTNLLKKIKLYGFRRSILFILAELHNILFMQFFKNSFSQNEEDIIIDKLLRYKKSGFYVDVGAYDPYRFSNTYRFYKKGWRGINIEPNTANYKKFILTRPKDINLNIGVGSKKGNVTFYLMFPDTLSTFSKKDAVYYKKLGFKIVGKSKIKIKRLNSVLSKYSRNQKIDFFSIDTEGYEMEVLRSNNWTKFKPKIICIESSNFVSDTQESKERTEIRKFLTSLGYKKAYSNKTNYIYKLNF